MLDSGEMQFLIILPSFSHSGAKVRTSALRLALPSAQDILSYLQLHNSRGDALGGTSNRNSFEQLSWRYVESSSAVHHEAEGCLFRYTSLAFLADSICHSRMPESWLSMPGELGPSFQKIGAKSLQCRSRLEDRGLPDQCNEPPADFEGELIPRSNCVLSQPPIMLLAPFSLPSYEVLPSCC